MSKWYDNQNKSSGNFCKLPQEQIDKFNQHRKLIVKIDEQIQLAANKDNSTTPHK